MDIHTAPSQGRRIRREKNALISDYSQLDGNSDSDSCQGWSYEVAGGGGVCVGRCPLGSKLRGFSKLFIVVAYAVWRLANITFFTKCM